MNTYRLFDNYAHRYDQWYTRHPVTAENEAKAVEAAIDGRPVAEIGAGTGFFAARLAAEAAIDPSLPMLQQSLLRRPALHEPVQALGENLPLRSNTFRTVLLVVTLCFLDNPHPVLDEARRILAPDGTLVACIVPRGSPWGRHYLEKARQGHPLYRVARFYTVAEAAALLEEHGLQVEPKAIATLTSYGPRDKPQQENPVKLSLEEAEKTGFTCIKATKNAFKKAP